MFTVMLERGSWLIYKVGMPMVFFYHALLSNLFLGTAAEDAHGLEKWGNLALTPVQYLCEGKTATLAKDAEGNLVYQLEPRFDYKNHFFVKTASSIAALPFSLAVGSTLKGLSYITEETKNRAQQIETAFRSKNVNSNTPYYASIGLEMDSYAEAEFIDPPQFVPNPNVDNRLEGDVEALKEVARILGKHNIPFWLDCGTCLGTWQYGGAIPGDWDIDVGVLVDDFDNIWHALQELDPEKYVVQDWSARNCPKSYLKVFVHETGGLIDLYNYRIDPKAGTVAVVFSNKESIFLPPSWKTREKRYETPMPISHVFPLKKALFEGVEVPVPGEVVQYLQTFYGENISPARVYNEVTEAYEKDLSHPYWQLPEAH